MATAFTLVWIFGRSRLNFSSGISARQAVTTIGSRAALMSGKSVPIVCGIGGSRETFLTDLTTLTEARDSLKPIIEKVWRHCATTSTRGRTVTLKVKYADFHQITRSRTSDVPLASQNELEQFSCALLEATFPAKKGIRLLGVTLYSLCEEPHNENQLQLSL